MADGNGLVAVGEVKGRELCTTTDSVNCGSEFFFGLRVGLNGCHDAVA